MPSTLNVMVPRALAGSCLPQTATRKMKAAAVSASSGLSSRGAPLAPRRRVCTRAVRSLGNSVTAQLNEVADVISHVAAQPVDVWSQMMYTIADADPAVAEAVAEASDNGGFLGPIVGGLEWLLKILDSAFENVGVPYSYGFSIIALTILVKVLTFPLSKQQVESTIAMQKIQPKVKQLQSQWGNDKERLQVFIGLYRALTNVADEGLLTDGFFWIPSLAGPTSLSAREAGEGFSWLSIVDGAPAIGWHDAISYLVLPVVLTISQFVSQKLM
ncbi:hypothetical protein CYMTET_31725, partial [Cymbomonas tetramitiformis]